MKKILLTAALAITAIAASAQNGFMYQAVIRDDGKVLENKSVNMRFSILLDNEVYYTEQQTTTTNEYGNISVNIGEGTVLKGSFNAVPWESMKTMLRIETDTKGDGNFIDMGSIKLQPVPYAYHAQSANNIDNASKIQIKADTETSDDEALFAVKDDEDNVVFAVYKNGVRVYVDDTEDNKAAKSGFAVAGRSARKDGINEYFTVNADGTQVFVDDDDDDDSKAAKSKFAVAGRSAKKDGENANLFAIDENGTQVFVDDDDDSKAAKSKFAVAGRSAKKDDSSLFAVDKSGTVGDNTAALGQLAQASGEASTAMGYNASAMGDYSTAFGQGSDSEGEGSFAAGSYSTASGAYSTALGQGSSAEGYGSFAAGSYASAVGDVNLALGNFAKAEGRNAMAIGSNAKVGKAEKVTHNEVLGGCRDCPETHDYESDGSFAIGANAQALGEGVMAIGNNASAVGRFTFAIGNWANAYGPGSIAMGSASSANGSNSVAIGSGCQANDAGVAIGFAAESNGAGSFAIGTDCDANGWASVALGKSSSAKADLSYCIGEASETLGESSFCLGFHSKARENNSIAIGNYIRSNNPWEIVMGVFNDSTVYEGYDRIYSIGCGYGWSDWRNAMVVLRSGNIGIGTSTPNYLLEVNGTIKANNVSETSDLRLKRNVTTLNNSLQKILQMRGVNFYWKPEEEIKNALGTHEKCQYPETKQIGVIAQEVEKIVPEVVETDAKGFKSVDYSKLTPVLIEAVKELKAEKDELEARVDKLEKMLEELMNKQ